MLTVSNLCFEYAEVPLLTNVNFSVHAGELLHLKGQNGAGKSTLLKLLASLLRPLSGEILFEEVPLQRALEHYRSKMCYLGHLEGIHPLLTPRDVWAFEMTHTSDTPTLTALSDILQLGEVIDTPFALLSAGQKKRVGMMRLLMRQEAKVWLLDEPWAALDTAGVEQLLCFTSHHLKRGGLVITTSHQPLPVLSFSVCEYTL